MTPPVSAAGRRAGNGLVRGLAWPGLLGAVAWGGSRLGRGALAPPVLTEPGSWGGWAAARSPVEASFALLALVLVALAWYLAAVTALATAGRLVRAAHLVRVADVLTVPLLRPAVNAALGVGLVGATVAGVAGGPASRHGPRVLHLAEASLVVVDADPGRPPPGASAGPAGSAQPDDPSSRPVMRLLPPEPPAAEAAPPSEPAPPPRGSSPPAPAPVPPTEWELRPGDHLWSVAAGVLEHAWGTPATDAEVAPYWKSLVEANQAMLADPANPDLVYPGQIVTVPAPPPAPR